MSLSVNTPDVADDWLAWTDEARWMPSLEDYPGLTGPQILLVQLYEQAVRARADMPSVRRCARLLGKQINAVVGTRRILIRKSWIEVQPVIRLGQHGPAEPRRYRLTQAALDRMVRRDALAARKEDVPCIAS